MRFLIFTICFVAACLVPPIFHMGVYKNEAGRWVFSTPYAITFLIIAFLFIHEFIHVFSHEAHDEAEGHKEKPKS